MEAEHPEHPAAAGRCALCELPLAQNGPGEPYCRCPDDDEIPTGSLFGEPEKEREG